MADEMGKILGLDESAEEKTEQSATAVSVDSLKLELAKANAEIARFKNSVDKLAKENKGLTDWKRERMSAEEKRIAEEQERNEYVKSLETYKQVNEASKRYLSFGMDTDLAYETAQAEAAGDMETVLSNIQKSRDTQISAAKTSWLNSRPDIPAGSRAKEKSEDDMLREVFMKEFKR